MKAVTLTIIRAIRLLFFLAFTAQVVTAQSPSLTLSEAVTLLNTSPKLQVNLETFGTSTQLPSSVLTNWATANERSLRQLCSGLTNHVIIEAHGQAFTIAEIGSATLAESPMNYRFTDFAVTNETIVGVLYKLCTIAPFNLEFHKPLLIDKTSDLETMPPARRWTQEELHHAVTLESKTRSLRDVLSEVINPHFKAYTISRNELRNGRTNVLIVIQRPDESAENSILRRLAPSPSLKSE